jgi:hypothetical protein
MFLQIGWFELLLIETCYVASSQKKMRRVGTVRRMPAREIWIFKSYNNRGCTVGNLPNLLFLLLKSIDDTKM